GVVVERAKTARDGRANHPFAGPSAATLLVGPYHDRGSGKRTPSRRGLPMRDRVGREAHLPTRAGQAAGPVAASSLVLGGALVPLVANLEEGDGIHRARCSGGRAGDSMLRR